MRGFMPGFAVDMTSNHLPEQLVLPPPLQKGGKGDLLLAPKVERHDPHPLHRP